MTISARKRINVGKAEGPVQTNLRPTSIWELSVG